MSTKPALLIVGVVVVLAGGCTAGEDGSTAGTSSDEDASTSPGASGDVPGAGDTTSPHPTTDGAEPTSADPETDSAGGETTEEPPATCLDGKVGVLNVNTEVVFRNDSDFVVHTYPSNHSNDVPPQLDDFFAKVDADPSVDKNFLFASGFSYGASMSLRHGWIGSERIAGIIHVSQYSNPDKFQDAITQATRRVPIYIIHDNAYGHGGLVLRDYLLDVGYEMDVNLFYLDFRGGHDIPSPTEMETVLDWMKTMSLNGLCEDDG
jgi:hypothetical protein